MSDYSKMTVTTLRAELSNRGLSRPGKKSDMIKMLQLDDASKGVDTQSITVAQDGADNVTDDVIHEQQVDPDSDPVDPKNTVGDELEQDLDTTLTNEDDEAHDEILPVETEQIPEEDVEQPMEQSANVAEEVENEEAPLTEEPENEIQEDEGPNQEDQLEAEFENEEPYEENDAEIGNENEQTDHVSAEMEESIQNTEAMEEKQEETPSAEIREGGQTKEEEEKQYMENETVPETEQSSLEQSDNLDEVFGERAEASSDMEAETTESAAVDSMEEVKTDSDATEVTAKSETARSKESQQEGETKPFTEINEKKPTTEVEGENGEDEKAEVHIDTVGEVDPAFALSLALLEADDKADGKDGQEGYEEEDFEKSRFEPLAVDEDYEERPLKPRNLRVTMITAYYRDKKQSALYLDNLKKSKLLSDTMIGLAKQAITFQYHLDVYGKGFAFMEFMHAAECSAAKASLKDVIGPNAVMKTEKELPPKWMINKARDNEAITFTEGRHIIVQDYPAEETSFEKLRELFPKAIFLTRISEACAGVEKKWFWRIPNSTALKYVPPPNYNTLILVEFCSSHEAKDAAANVSKDALQLSDTVTLTVQLMQEYEQNYNTQFAKQQRQYAIERIFPDEDRLEMLQMLEAKSEELKELRINRRWLEPKDKEKYNDILKEVSNMTSAIKIDTLLRLKVQVPVPESTKLMTRHTYSYVKVGKLKQIKQAKPKEKDTEKKEGEDKVEKEGEPAADKEDKEDDGTEPATRKRSREGESKDRSVSKTRDEKKPKLEESSPKTEGNEKEETRSQHSSGSRERPVRRDLASDRGRRVPPRGRGRGHYRGGGVDRRLEALDELRRTEEQLEMQRKVLEKCERMVESQKRAAVRGRGSRGGARGGSRGASRPMTSPRGGGRYQGRPEPRGDDRYRGADSYYRNDDRYRDDERYRGEDRYRGGDERYVVRRDSERERYRTYPDPDLAYRKDEHRYREDKPYHSEARADDLHYRTKEVHSRKEDRGRRDADYYADDSRAYRGRSSTSSSHRGYERSEEYKSRDRGFEHRKDVYEEAPPKRIKSEGIPSSSTDGVASVANVLKGLTQVINSKMDEMARKVVPPPQRSYATKSTDLSRPKAALPRTALHKYDHQF